MLSHINKVKSMIILSLCLGISTFYCNTVYAINPAITDSVKKDNPIWYNDTSYKEKEKIEDTRKKARDMQKKMLDTSLARYQPSDKLVTPNIDLNATSGADKSTPSPTKSSSSPATPDNKDKMSPLHITGLSSDKLAEAVKKKSANSTKLQYIKSFEEAEKKYGVNSVFLLALTIQESGWTEKSGGVSAKYHNPFSIKKSRTEWKNFNSYAEGVDVGAKNLKDNYVTKNGKYYKGDNIEDMSIYYVNGGSGKDTNWSNAIKGFMKTIYDALGM